MALVLLVLLVVALLAAYPSWSHSRNWGYYPIGGLGLLILVVVLLALFGPIPWYGWYHAPYVDSRPVVIERPVTVVRPVIVQPTEPTTTQPKSLPSE